MTARNLLGFHNGGSHRFRAVRDKTGKSANSSCRKCLRFQIHWILYLSSREVVALLMTS